MITYTKCPTKFTYKYPRKFVDCKPKGPTIKSIRRLKRLRKLGALLLHVGDHRYVWVKGARSRHGARWSSEESVLLIAGFKSPAPAVENLVWIADHHRRTPNAIVGQLVRLKQLWFDQQTMSYWPSGQRPTYHRKPYIQAYTLKKLTEELK